MALEEDYAPTVADVRGELPQWCQWLIRKKEEHHVGDIHWGNVKMKRFDRNGGSTAFTKSPFGVGKPFKDVAPTRGVPRQIGTWKGAHGISRTRSPSGKNGDQ